jgi:hypothetical protein
MPERVLYPQWRKQNESTKYPFGDDATLVNDAGFAIIEGTFLDAALYPIGGGIGLYISSITVDHQSVTLVVGDLNDPSIATASFPLINPPDLVSLVDNFGRPAGVLVSESARLGIFQSWTIGTQDFSATETGFAATVCFPTPETGVRGFQLDDGSILTGDVWLVGDDGVVLREELTELPPKCGVSGSVRVIRVDVVGDPLFRRRLCTPHSLFKTPRFIEKVRVLASNTEFICGPDLNGNLKMTVNNNLAADTVLRLRPSPNGMIIEAVGSPASG